MTEQEHQQLDARVAEQVMGWIGLRQEASGWFTGFSPNGGGGWVPSFSSEIEAAWQVAKKLREQGARLSIMAVHEGWIAYVGACEISRCKQVSEAICRAALAWAERK